MVISCCDCCLHYSHLFSPSHLFSFHFFPLIVVCDWSVCMMYLSQPTAYDKDINADISLELGDDIGELSGLIPNITLSSSRQYTHIYPLTFTLVRSLSYPLTYPLSYIMTHPLAYTPIHPLSYTHYPHTLYCIIDVHRKYQISCSLIHILSHTSSLIYTHYPHTLYCTVSLTHQEVSNFMLDHC